MLGGGRLDNSVVGRAELHSNDAPPVDDASSGTSSDEDGDGPTPITIAGSSVGVSGFILVIVRWSYLATVAVEDMAGEARHGLRGIASDLRISAMEFTDEVTFQFVETSKMFGHILRCVIVVVTCCAAFWITNMGKTYVLVGQHW